MSDTESTNGQNSLEQVCADKLFSVGETGDPKEKLGFSQDDIDVLRTLPKNIASEIEARIVQDGIPIEQVIEGSKKVLTPQQAAALKTVLPAVAENTMAIKECADNSPPLNTPGVVDVAANKDVPPRA